MMFIYRTLELQTILAAFPPPFNLSSDWPSLAIKKYEEQVGGASVPIAATDTDDKTITPCMKI